MTSGINLLTTSDFKGDSLIGSIELSIVIASERSGLQNLNGTKLNVLL